jgi:hypothetical protein
VRTTLDIAEDVLQAAKERARRERRSTGEVLSDLAREALVGAPRRDERAPTESFFGFEPFPRRGAAVSNALVDRLREEEPD